ncbi:hypothetical protein [Rhodococcus globerulus]|uniref:hypothetical protein n=1 Tax=Rhodococcus globerulus TaxID=33008 RepID=UPI003017F076
MGDLERSEDEGDARPSLSERGESHFHVERREAASNGSRCGALREHSYELADQSHPHDSSSRSDALILEAAVFYPLSVLVLTIFILSLLAP